MYKLVILVYSYVHSSNYIVAQVVLDTCFFASPSFWPWLRSSWAFILLFSTSLSSERRRKCYSYFNTKPL